MKFTPPYSPLLLIAGLSALIYLLVFSLPFPLSRLYATVPPVDYAKLTAHSPAGFVAYVSGLALLFGLYLWAIHLTAPAAAKPSGREAKKNLTSSPHESSPQPGVKFIILSGAVWAAILLFSYPLTAIDLFVYALRTRGWALYGFNPLATSPAQLPPGDPWLGLAAEWGDAPSPYGPVWEWLSLGVFHLSGGDFLAHLLALKLVAALAYLGCAWLIYLILRQTRPEWAIAGVIAFAWNPLVLLESAQNAHNDIVMAFFLLTAIWVMNQRMSEWRMAKGEEIPLIRHSQIRRFAHALVCLLLALSILVKFVTVLVVPFFLLALVSERQNWTARLAWLAGYGALIMGIVLLGMWPLWPGWDNWAVLQAGGQAGRSLLALLVLSLRGVIGLGWAFDGSSYLLLGIFAAIYIYWLIKAILLTNQSSVSPAPPLPHSPALIPIASSFFVLFWYVLLVAPVFHAWYLLWFIPLAPLLLPHRRPLNAAIVFSITALLMIPYFETIRVWYPLLLSNQWLGHAVGVPLLVIPPVLALFWPLKPESHSRHLP